MHHTAGIFLYLTSKGENMPAYVYALSSKHTLRSNLQLLLRVTHHVNPIMCTHEHNTTSQLVRAAHCGLILPFCTLKDKQNIPKLTFYNVNLSILVNSSVLLSKKHL